MNRNPGLVVFGLILAAAITLSAWMIAAPLREMKTAGQTMTVTGSSIRRISSDYAVWNSHVRVRGENIAMAYAALKTTREEVIAYFRKKGVKDSDVAISPINTNAIKRPNPNGYGTTEEIIGYELVLNFQITSQNVDYLEKLATNSTELLEQGIMFESDAPNYFYSKLEELKIELVGEAAANAQKRAEVIAGKTGTRIGPPRGVRIGVFQVRPINSTEVSDGGMLDTSSREKEAMAVVTINFGIES